MGFGHRPLCLTMEGRNERLGSQWKINCTVRGSVDIRKHQPAMKPCEMMVSEALVDRKGLRRWSQFLVALIPDREQPLASFAH